MLVAQSEKKKMETAKSMDRYEYEFKKIPFIFIEQYNFLFKYKTDHIFNG